MPPENTPQPDPAPAPTPDPAPSPTPPTPVPTPAMPEGLPADFWDATAGAPKWADLTKHLGELTQFKTEVDQRRAAVPAKPEDYKLALPEGFKLPDGAEFTIDDKAPEAAEIRAFAHRHGLTPAAVSELLAIDAARQVRGHEARVAELAKLGDKAAERIGTVESYLRANFKTSDEALAGLASSAAAVDLLEGLIAKANGGVIPTSATGGGDSAMSEEEYYRTHVFKS